MLSISSITKYFFTVNREEANLVDAAASGASNAVMLVSNIAANLIAFIAILEFINVTLTWFGQRVGIEELTFQVSNSLL
jgi:pyrimidine nucleoside transport protein